MDEITREKAEKEMLERLAQMNEAYYHNHIAIRSDVREPV